MSRKLLPNHLRKIGLVEVPPCGKKKLSTGLALPC